MLHAFSQSSGPWQPWPYTIILVLSFRGGGWVSAQVQIEEDEDIPKFVAIKPESSGPKYSVDSKGDKGL